DGFCYPPNDSFTCLGQTIALRHGRPGWVEIDLAAELDHFERFVAFAEKFFDTARNNIRAQFFYNYEHMRIDLRCYREHETLRITFEPGYPTEDFDEELWRPIVKNESTG